MMFATAGICCVGCGLRQLPPVDSKLLDPNGTFTLHVSNQSFAISPVDIQVRIDGEVVVRQYFDVGNQHSWKTFRLALAPGEHKLQVSSVKGTAELTEEFVVTGEHWALIDYWYYPKVTGGGGPTPRKFIFNVQDTPIMFE